MNPLSRLRERVLESRSVTYATIERRIVDRLERERRRELWADRLAAGPKAEAQTAESLYEAGDDFRLAGDDGSEPAPAAGFESKYLDWDRREEVIRCYLTTGLGLIINSPLFWLAVAIGANGWLELWAIDKAGR